MKTGDVVENGLGMLSSRGDDCNPNAILVGSRPGLPVGSLSPKTTALNMWLNCGLLPGPMNLTVTPGKKGSDASQHSSWQPTSETSRAHRGGTLYQSRPGTAIFGFWKRGLVLAGCQILGQISCFSKVLNTDQRGFHFSMS